MNNTVCMGCGNRTFDSKLDSCSTEKCIYNLTYENVEVDAEEERDETMHQGGDGSLLDEFGHGDLDENAKPLDGQMDNGPEIDGEVGDQESEKKQGDSGDLELSREQEVPDMQDMNGDESRDDGEDQKQDEEDDDLPERPMGCNGDCQPGDPGQDADPCPHCTAKQFKEEMRNEGKDDQPEELMEQDWKDFLEDWEKKAKQDSESGDEENFDDDLGNDPEEDLIEYTPDDFNDIDLHDLPDMDVEGDEGLPPRPQGCNGDCKPSDQYDENADPCPHCTAKQFRDDMQSEMDDDDGVDLEDMLEKFRQMLADWANEKERSKIDDADEDDEFSRVAKDMSVSQEKRYDNLVKRISKKVEQTFGETAEDFFVGRKSDGQFKGEEVSQTIQVMSRGVTYWVTISAARDA